MAELRLDGPAFGEQRERLLAGAFMLVVDRRTGGGGRRLGRRAQPD